MLTHVFMYSDDEDLDTTPQGELRGRYLSIQQELEQGKVWNFSTKRYNKKHSHKEESRLGLIYAEPYNIYINTNKTLNRCLTLEQERNSHLVWYPDLERYSYRLSAEKEQELNVKFNPEENTYRRVKPNPPPLKEKTPPHETNVTVIPPIVKPGPSKNSKVGEPSVPVTKAPTTPAPTVTVPATPAPIVHVIPEEPIIPEEPEIPEDIEDIMATKYQLKDLPSFAGDKDQDPQEFLFQFQNFLKYIQLDVRDGDSVKKALTHFGTCMTKKARIWFQNQVPDVEADRTVAQYNQVLKDFAKAFHPLGKTVEQLEMAWARLRWNPQSESIEDFANKVTQLAKVLSKSDAEGVLKIKMASPDADTYKMIMNCTNADEIIRIINQLQAMSFQPTGATAATAATGPTIPFMSAQHDPCKQVSFQEPIIENMSKMTDQIAMLTDHIDKMAVSINDSRKSPRFDRRDYRGRNRSHSGDRGRDRNRYDRYRSSSRDRDRRNRSNSRDSYRSLSRDRNRDRGRDYRRDDYYRYRDDRSRNYGRSDYRDYKPRDDRKRGYWKRINFSHCAGCSCNQPCTQQHNHNQQSSQNQNRSNGRTSRGNTPGPDRFNTMTERLHDLVDDSCNLLELHQQYEDSLNC